MKNLTAWSDETQTRYDSWDDLVSAEALGYVVIAVILDRDGKVKGANPIGLYPTKKKAQSVSGTTRVRAKNQFTSVRIFVRPLWKTEEQS